MGDTVTPLAEGREFELFPKLPLELRNMVWNEAAIVPQIIVIGYRRSPNPGFIMRVVNKTKPPAVLHASHESRRVALQDFEVTFENSAAPGCGIYFNFDRDALSFDFNDYYDLLTLSVLQMATTPTPALFFHQAR
ncbi:hypothetical protein BKA61DRAFT_568392 [Leptodontidium sp. MPI-SDFR-AT-0119]|nr:hypothetical protein BKA61DRAFT_568392 [Leptodontidium sp. MPI-SDFR-AT-0119]